MSETPELQEESQHSQQIVALPEAAPSVPARLDSGLGQSLPSQQVKNVDIAGGNLQESHFGDKNVQWTGNATHSVHNESHVTYNCYQGSEPKRPRKEDESEEERLDIQNLQFVNCISADKNKRLHDSKNIFRGEKKKARGSIPVAVKLLDFNELTAKAVDSLHRTDCHPNVVKIYESDLHSEGKIEYIFIAMELCSKETLYDYINRQGERYDLRLAIDHSTQLISGLKHIHDRGICHRDLKPQNVLFRLKEDETPCYDQIKITDFGVSKRLDASETQATTRGVGTAGYMAPEMVKLMEMDDKVEKEEASKKIAKSVKIDVFSLAVVLCFCLSKGHHPYGKVKSKRIAKIYDGEDPDLSQICVDEKSGAKVKNLLKRMLQHNPDDRPSMEEVWKEWQAILFQLEGNRKAQATGEVEHPIDPVPDISEEVVGQEELNPKFSTEGNSKLEAENSEDREGSIKEVARPSILLFEDGKTEICSVYSMSIIAGRKANIEEIAPLPASISSQTYTAVMIGQKVYVLTWRKYVFVLDLDNCTGGWRRLDSTRHLHGKYPPAAVLRDKIYVCGGGWDWKGRLRMSGETLQTSSDCCEVYDPTKQVGIWSRLYGGHSAWKRITSMQQERGHNSVAALGNHLYSIGGCDKLGEVLKSVERLDPDWNKWQFAAPLRKARYNAATAVYYGEIYVLGGETQMEFQQSIEVFNPHYGNWTLLSFEISCFGSLLSAVSHAGELYIIGNSGWMEWIDFKKEKCKLLGHILDFPINGKAALSLN